MTSSTEQRPLLSVASTLQARVVERQVAVILLVVYVLMIWFGYVQFRNPSTMMEGQELSYDRCAFLAINAATLTGFQQAVGMDEFRPGSVRGKATVLTLIVGGTLFYMIVGGMAVTRILRLPYNLLQIVLSSAVSIVLAVLIGSATLIGHGRDLFSAMFQSAAAFGNCGLTIGHLGSPADIGTYLLLLLSVFGGLGLPVLMELYDWLNNGRAVSRHARTVIRFSAGLYLLGFALLVPIQVLAQRDLPWSGWKQILATSSTQCVNARTAGMPLEMVSIMPRAGQWVLMLLMAIGASPGGSGGGLKTTTVAELFSGVRRLLRGQKVGRPFGIALTWTAIYLGMTFTFLLLLMILDQEIPPDRQLFIAISAASNVGLSHDSLSTVGPPLYLLAGFLLIARLVPLGILWWMAETTHDAELAIG